MSKIQCQTENFFYQRFDFVGEFTRYVKWKRKRGQLPKKTEVATVKKTFSPQKINLKKIFKKKDIKIIVINYCKKLYA
jgi:hypothetical protein